MWQVPLTTLLVRNSTLHSVTTNITSVSSYLTSLELDYILSNKPNLVPAHTQLSQDVLSPLQRVSLVFWKSSHTVDKFIPLCPPDLSCPPAACWAAVLCQALASSGAFKMLMSPWLCPLLGRVPFTSRSCRGPRGASVSGPRSSCKGLTHE